jgi:protein-L-isoaspartate O-methyltransferase
VASCTIRLIEEVAALTPSPAYYNEEVYAAWRRPLLEDMFGDEMDLHYDLYEQTHSHRREHNGGQDQGPCIAWPSPPYRAPTWRIVAEVTEATKFLEVGTALGYCAALMADAGGPNCRVDTIESYTSHADIAEAELTRRGLGDRVQVLRGDEADVLASLTGPYDVVFLDGGRSDVRHQVDRLLRPGGAAPEIKGRLQQPLMRILEDGRASIEAGEQPRAQMLSWARESYRRAVIAALEDSSGT